MTIYIHYMKRPAPGYTPRAAVRLHNVNAVVDKGTNRVEIHMAFTDHQPTHDHVDRVVIEPDRD